MPSIPGDVVEPGFAPSAPNRGAFSEWLDWFRWIAAASVVLDHCANRFTVHLIDLARAQRTVPFYAFAFFAGFAHQAVMIFFVLSGYLVGGGLWRERARTGSMRVGTYMLKRVSRLCIVLYPAFLLIALLNLIGIYGMHGLASGAYQADVLPRTGPGTLVCNVAFLQTATCDTYGSDGALWSLFNEFWYYLLWPLILLACTRSALHKRLGWLLLLLALLLALTLLPLGAPLHAAHASTVVAYMAIWLLGIPVAARDRPLIASVTTSSILFLAMLLGTRIAVRRTLADEHPGIQFLVDFTLGLVFSNLLLSLKHCKTLRTPPLRRYNELLAGFSFSLYCVHIPILNLYNATMRRITGEDAAMLPRHAAQWLAIGGALVVSCLGAYAFSRLTEAHTQQFRSWLERKFALLRFSSARAGAP